MPRRTTRSTTTANKKPSLMARMRGKPKAAPATVETHSSRNPITGTTTTTTTTKQKSHPNGIGHHGHGGTGPMAGSSGRRAPATHHRRKASMGDKVSGALTKLKGSLTRRPGKKAAGTRRMHGTDGRGSHRTY